MIYETHELPDGRKVEIHYDDCAESPREWDNVSTFYFNNGFNEAKDFQFGQYESQAEAMKAVINHCGDVGVIVPVYKYQHSGVIYSTTPFSCPWDSCCIGFAVVTKEKIREEYSCKNMSSRVRNLAIERIKAEVEVFSNYANGQIFRFETFDAEGNEEDSCGGFISDEPLKDMVASGYLDKEWLQTTENV